MNVGVTVLFVILAIVFDVAAHTVEICAHVVGSTVNFYAGTYHSAIDLEDSSNHAGGIILSDESSTNQHYFTSLVMDSNESPSGVNDSELVCARCENYQSESIQWWQLTSVSGLSDGTFSVTTTNNNVVDTPFCPEFPDITLSGIKTSIPTQNPTSKPTSNPSHAPTDITSAPSAEPTAPPTWVIPCEHSPCQCDTSLSGFEDPNCHICHGNGCSQCKDVGTYWKLSYNHPCVNCKETFGDGCMFCQDFNGCGQCTQGYTRQYDSEAGLYYCSLSTPKQTVPPTDVDSTSCTDGISPCGSSKCFGSGENPHCSNQQFWGCPNCNSGYFMKGHDYPCVSCDTLQGCISCSDWNGCTRCASGYTSQINTACGISMCVKNM